MSNFDTTWPVILEHEVGPYRESGGLVDHPDDPGGITKWGISLRWLRTVGDLDGDGFLDGDLDQDGDVDADDIRMMTDEQAKTFYRQHWWDKYRYHVINHQRLATKAVDLSINMGAKQAHTIIQRSLRATGVCIAVDGIFGPKSFSAINRAAPNELLPAIREGAAGFYRALILRNAALRKRGHDVPDFSKFRTGWMNRAYY